MTKGELAKLVLTEQELKNIDFALPLNFVEDCENLLAIDVRAYYVWSYIDTPIGGRPLNLAERYYEKFKGSEILLDSAKCFMADAIDRGECFKEGKKGEMYDDYLGLAHAIDIIELNKTHG